jgi:hypothetical protein
VAVRAPRAYPIHDALVNDAFAAIVQRVLVPIVERFGVEFFAWDGPVIA